MTLQVTDEQLQAVVTNIVLNVVDKLKPTAQMPDEKMLSAKEVAGLLSISARSVADYTKQNKLRSYRLGGSVRYKRTEVLASWQAMSYGRR
jgi:excisionase family DNA binding protein